ncbi:hypothetical protein ScPMuIL_010922 [Solemya velum]
MSLVIGEGPELTTIQDLITQVTTDHELQLCPQEEAFDITNKHSFTIIWLQMAIPASQEVLSLTTSIRYASKSNRNTVIIGFAAVISMVDLRLHGIDEILAPPWTCTAIRQKYAKWTSVTLAAEGTGGLTDDEKTQSAPSVTSSNPSANPDTPVSVTSEETDRSCYSVETSPTLSNIEAQQPIPTFATLRNLVPNMLNCPPVRPRHIHPNDHTTKEKLRRLLMFWGENARRPTGNKGRREKMKKAAESPSFSRRYIDGGH